MQSSRSKPKVHLLKSGSVLRDKCGKILDARSSVTLVIQEGKKIVVDTGLFGEEEIILDALARLELRPEDIDAVVNTHSHPDHCGNNHIFSKSKTLNAKEAETIAPGLYIMETPGHSLDSISVVVEASEIVVVAGDALPTFDNFLKNVPPALHIDRDLAVSSMERITVLADVVVPGHDRPFSTRERRYVTLPV
ncbi:MAG: MBL fold metallo-hydrolase [Methanothrix sp.]|nr:MBL fold metallo-hydrolase [Methanothrix sp.]